MKNSVTTIVGPGIDGGCPNGVGAEMLKIFYLKFAVLTQAMEMLIQPDDREFLVWRLSFHKDNVGFVVHGVVEKCKKMKVPDGVSVLSGAGETGQGTFVVLNQGRFNLQPQTSDAEIVEHVRRLISTMGLHPAPASR